MRKQQLGFEELSACLGFVVSIQVAGLLVFWAFFGWFFGCSFFLKKRGEKGSEKESTAQDEVLPVRTCS